MILPTKHIPPQQSLIGIGAILLSHLNRDRTVTDLWERVRGVKQIGTFERFILALDLLYAIGAVRLERGLLRVFRAGSEVQA